MTQKTKKLLENRVVREELVQRHHEGHHEGPKPPHLVLLRVLLLMLPSLLRGRLRLLLRIRVHAGPLLLLLLPHVTARMQRLIEVAWLAA